MVTRLASATEEPDRLRVLRSENLGAHSAGSRRAQPSHDPCIWHLATGQFTQDHAGQGGRLGIEQDVGRVRDGVIKLVVTQWPDQLTVGE